MPEEARVGNAERPEVSGRQDGGREERVAGVVAVPTGPVEPQPLLLDETLLQSAYTNFVRVTGTAEEVILDVGLNKEQPQGGIQPTVEITQRIVVSFYTAKRLLNAIRMSVLRHEANFGRLETDVRRRLVKKAT